MHCNLIFGRKSRCDEPLLVLYLSTIEISHCSSRLGGVGQMFNLPVYSILNAIGRLKTGTASGPVRILEREVCNDAREVFRGFCNRRPVGPCPHQFAWSLQVSFWIMPAFAFPTSLPFTLKNTSPLAFHFASKLAGPVMAAGERITVRCFVHARGETQMAFVEVNAIAISIAAVSEDDSGMRIGANRAFDLQ